MADHAGVNREAKDAKSAKVVPFEEFAERLGAIFHQVEAQGEGITVEREGQLFALRPKRQRVRSKGGGRGRGYHSA